MVPLRSSNKPPLPARSPIMLRSRRKPLPPITATPNTKPLAESSQSPDLGKSGVIRPEYHTISCELKALAKMVNRELGAKDQSVFSDFDPGAQQKMGPLFERGRFYDEYSARRNERLERKRRQSSEGCFGLGVRIESCKKKETGRSGSSRSVKAVSSTPKREIQASSSSSSVRYSLRSHSKDCNSNNKPSMIPLPASMMVNGERSVGGRRMKNL